MGLEKSPNFQALFKFSSSTPDPNFTVLLSNDHCNVVAFLMRPTVWLHRNLWAKWALVFEIFETTSSTYVFWPENWITSVQEYFCASPESTRQRTQMHIRYFFQTVFREGRDSINIYFLRFINFFNLHCIGEEVTFS